MASNQDRKPQKPFNAYARYSSLGLQMAVIITAGSYGGHKLDQYYENGTPVFTIVLSLLSIGIALYIVLRDVMKPRN